MNGNDYLSSTELLPKGQDTWLLAGELPSPLTGLRGLNLDNKILMTGRHYLGLYFSTYITFLLLGGFDDHFNFHDEILEFDVSLMSWHQVGRMTQPRDYHAVSNVVWEEVEQFCFS